MQYLVGEYEHQMDTKNRIRIPSKLAGEEKGFYLTRGIDTPCILAYYDEAFATLTNKILSQTMLCDSESSMANRIFAKNAIWLDCDAQGRMILPPKFKAYAKIDRDIVICGAGDHIEIWARDEYDRFYANENEDFTALLKKFRI